MLAQDAPFRVHLASEPDSDDLQRCTRCAVVLKNNQPIRDGLAAVPDGQDNIGATWWDTGALVATDRHDPAGPVFTYTVNARDLDDDEQHCTPA